MSMPSFPKDGANMTREQALTMIIASIAMEESALSHIINAEGEKLRRVLDQCGCGVTPQEILKVNKSVTKLLEAAAENQTMLRCKLALALEGGCGCPAPEPPCPSPDPPCPPPQKSLMQLGLSGCGFVWKNEGRIPWKCLGGRGGSLRWSRETPYLVELEPGRAWSVQATFNLRSLPAAPGRICMKSAGMSTEPPPLYFTGSGNCACAGPVTLQYATLLLPGRAATVSFLLHAGADLCVEQAELNIAEL